MVHTLAPVAPSGTRLRLPNLSSAFSFLPSSSVREVSYTLRNNGPSREVNGAHARACGSVRHSPSPSKPLLSIFLPPFQLCSGGFLHTPILDGVAESLLSMKPEIMAEGPRCKRRKQANPRRKNGKERVAFTPQCQL
ncbi:hypothetical protein PGIGA_G00212050 [Pangasianodon gigas]|uniref:Uncharacterized protein n=1 Tax=Pangasianodon gigas TaxID=30993 RepID=A0ACC5WGC5_PANGG|nr:hypothetical protein [Pangasianodon gigas]